MERAEKNAYIVIGIVLMVLALWLGTMYVVNNYNKPARPEFTGYKPHGAANEKLVLNHRSSSGEWWYVYSFAAENGELDIKETISRPGHKLLTDCSYFKLRCAQEKLSDSKSYFVKRLVENENLKSIEAEAILGNTYVQVEVDKTRLEKYDTFDWRKFFLSLDETDLSKIRPTLVDIKPYRV